jgi:hypothetical protein
MKTREPLEDSHSGSNHDDSCPRKEIKKTIQNPTERCTLSDVTAASPTYNSRKPKWWKYLAGRATKAQKRAIQDILDDRHLRLMDIPYGSMLDWDDVFPLNKTNNHGVHEYICDPSKQKTHRRKVWLELGFGRGENLLALAHRYRNDRQFHLVGAE